MLYLMEFLRFAGDPEHPKGQNLFIIKIKKNLVISEYSYGLVQFKIIILYLPSATWFYMKIKFDMGLFISK